MSNLFERPRVDLKSVRWVKEMISQRLRLPDNVTLAVAELRCHEEGCPPVETVASVRYEDGQIKKWRFAKPVKDISCDDIDLLGAPTKYSI